MVIDVVFQQHTHVVIDFTAADTSEHQIRMMLLSMIEILWSRENSPTIRAFDLPGLDAAIHWNISSKMFQQDIQRLVLKLAMCAAVHKLLPSFRVR